MLGSVSMLRLLANPLCKPFPAFVIHEKDDMCVSLVNFTINVTLAYIQTEIIGDMRSDTKRQADSGQNSSKTKRGLKC